MLRSDWRNQFGSKNPLQHLKRISYRSTFPVQVCDWSPNQSAKVKTQPQDPIKTLKAKETKKTNEGKDGTKEGMTMWREEEEKSVRKYCTADCAGEQMQESCRRCKTD